MATIAQPTIVTTRPVYYVNRSEMTSARGVLKLLQVVAGVICYALFYVKITIFVGSNDLQRFGKNMDDIMNRMTSLSRLTTLLHQTSFCFWLVTFLMLVTCFKTQSTGSLLRMTAFEPIYHIVAGILYLSGGIGLIIVIRGSASIFPNLFAAGEPVYHILAAVFYLCGGIGLIAVIRDLAKFYPTLFAAGFLGSFAGFLHAIHGYYSWKDWQA